MKTYNNPLRNITSKKIKAPNIYTRKINRIVIHCTATSQTATVDAILKYFKVTLGWKNPGYHYIIAPDGVINKTLPMSEISNGVKGYNLDSVHISYIGGKFEDDRTEAQKASMKWLIKNLRLPSELGPIPVIGHRDLSPDTNNNGVVDKWEWIKRCPSFDVKEWLIQEGID